MIYPYLPELKYNLNFGKSPYNERLRNWIFSIAIEKKNIFLASKEFEPTDKCYDSGPIRDQIEEYKHYCNCGRNIRYKYQIKNKLTGKLYPDSDLERPRVKALGCVCIFTFLPDEKEKIKLILKRVKENYDKFNKPWLYCLNCKKKMKEGICLICARKLIREFRKRKRELIKS